MAICAASLVPAQLHAADCKALVSDLAAYQSADSLNRVDAIVTTNQSDRGFASVTLYLPLTFDSNFAFCNGGTQFFSDRGSPPFTGKTDKQGLRISRTDPMRVELILESWNNGKLVGTPYCDSAVMYGPLSGGQGAFSISFHKGRSIP
jgi:hypothetical protein